MTREKVETIMWPCLHLRRVTYSDGEVEVHRKCHTCEKWYRFKDCRYYSGIITCRNCIDD